MPCSCPSVRPAVPSKRNRGHMRYVICTRSLLSVTPARLQGCKLQVASNKHCPSTALGLLIILPYRLPISIFLFAFGLLLLPFAFAFYHCAFTIFYFPFTFFLYRFFPFLFFLFIQFNSIQFIHSPTHSRLHSSPMTASQPTDRSFVCSLSCVCVM